MNRRQFIPMLLGTAFIDVSKLNFSKSDVYLKKKEIFSKLIETDFEIQKYINRCRSIINDISKDNGSEYITMGHPTSLPSRRFDNITQFYNIIIINVSKYSILGQLKKYNYSPTYDLEKFVNNYIFPKINSKDDLKHYYENIEILEELNKEEFLKCKNDINYFSKNYYTVN